MAREGIEPPTRGFSGRQRPILPGLSRSISDRPASTSTGPRSIEYHREPLNTADTNQVPQFAPAPRFTTSRANARVAGEHLQESVKRVKSQEVKRGPLTATRRSDARGTPVPGHSLLVIGPPPVLGPGGMATVYLA
jgi:hypothetical protein